MKHPTKKTLILDYILTNFSACYNTPQILSPLGSSDHNVIVRIPLIYDSKNYVSKVLVMKRNMSAMNAFGRWQSSYTSTSLYDTTFCEQKFNIFHATIEAGMDFFSAIKLIKIHTRDKPWITAKLKKLILSTSSGPDYIPYLVSKSDSLLLVLPITSTFNRSSNLRTFQVVGYVLMSFLSLNHIVPEPEINFLDSNVDEVL